MKPHDQVPAPGFSRYAVYFTPQGALAEAGAAWLGWDLARGKPVPHPVLPDLDLDPITRTPRTYGLHATIKPPFVLKPGVDATGLMAAVEALCADLTPVTMGPFEVASFGPFLALRPTGDQTALAALAAQTVKTLDPFRAPPTPEELSRRRQKRLTPAQEHNLLTWGYPHVMDQFRFHITLTGRLDRATEPAVRAAAMLHFAPALTTPTALNSLTVVGQGADGMFREIKHCPLGR